MINKKLIFLAIFLISLISISAVNAAEDISNDDGKELILEESVAEDISDVDGKDLVLEESVGEDISDEVNELNLEETDTLMDSSNEEILKATEGTFTDLESLINSSGHTVSLSNNYTFSESDSYDEGIVINHDLTLEGNGFTINGANLSRVFKIYHGEVVIRNVTFINCYASYYGGAIDGPCTVINCTFANNAANFGGAIHTGTAIDCNFTQNKATTFGGAIFEGKSINCTFINNSARRGGGIYKNTALDCTFINNTADDYAGAAAETKLSNCSFIDNHADYGGAVMYGVVTNCTFINNTAGYGGAIYVANASDSIFRSNSATSHGGAIYSGNGDNCSFNNNTAEYGGAIDEGIAINSTFINNHADYGGAIYNGASADSFFISNNASIGGAMHVSSATNCSFINNTAEYGGALSVTDASNCTFINNTATRRGGAMQESNAKDCVFKNNTCTSEGGAIYQTNASNCTFTNNSAQIGGAILYGNATNCTFIRNNASIGGALDAGIAINCNFTYNSAEYGGAIYMANATACNFTNNLATKDGGALYSGYAIDCTFIYNNANSSGGAIMEATATACSFINNSAQYGGASFGSNVANSNFTNNNATMGGALDAGFAIACNFTSNRASDEGGALAWSNATDCIFTDNRAEYGGALYKGNAFFCSFINNTGNHGGSINGGSAINCNFTNNSAVYGGAISGSNASNCTFINNSAEQGGAISGSNASNCTFINNSAEQGGAISWSNATDCNFTNNTATYGGAASGANVTNCTFFTNFADNKGCEDIYNTNDVDCNFIVPEIIVSNFTSKFGSSKKLIFDLAHENQNFNGYNITIAIYQNDELVGTFDGLTGDGFLVDFEPGNYEAVLSLERSNVESVNITIEVLKIPTVISVNNISTTYDVEAFLVIDFKDDEEYPMIGCVLIVDYNGESKNYTTDINGQVRISTDGLAPDSYPLNISYGGNEHYNGSSTTAEIVVIKAGTQLIANDISTTYKKDTNFTVTLKDSSNRTISDVEIVVYLNGEKTYTTDENGQITVSTIDLAANNYVANIMFNGNQFFDQSENSVIVNVSKAFTQMVSTNITVLYNMDGCIIATLFDDYGNPMEGFNISAVLVGDSEGETFTTDENGQINIPVKGLLPDRYAVMLYFNGTDNYISSGHISVINILKLDPELNVNLSIMENNVTITLYSDNSLTGIVQYALSGISGYIPMENGSITYMYVLDNGDYNLTINYLGDEIYNTSTIFKEFNVVGHIKKNTTISASVAITGMNIIITVNLDPNATGGVYFNVNDDYVYAKVTDGKAVLNNVFSPGEYTVSASYLGDIDFNPNSTETSFTVKKYSTKVISSQIVTTYGTSKNLVVTLKDSNDNILIGKTVSIKLNGKTYTKVTNADGKISIAVPSSLAVKTYDASISFAGDNYFDKSSKSIKVIVKKATPKLTAKAKRFKLKVKTKKYKITLKTDKNKALKKVKVTLKVKGKTYKAKTNKKGKATFKIKNLKKKGKFKAVIKFAGNKYYKKLTKKVKITVKK